MISTTDFKRGVKIEYDNKAWTIIEFQHVNPGKGAAFTRTKMKNLETGRVVEVSFRSGDKVGVPDVQTRQMQYLYTDGSNFNFMDQQSYDQISLTAEEVGDTKDYMLENSVIAVTYYNGKPVAVEVDTFVNLVVKETQPNIKGDTSGGGGKPATMETGLIVKAVPFHINEGDVLKIDTRTGEYVERVNSK